jgi:hypothetical protein
VSFLFQTSALLVSGITFAGLVWWIKSIVDVSRRIEKEITDTSESLPVEQNKLVLNEVGTGQKAERLLGASLAGATEEVFLSGAITKTVYNLIRDWLPYRCTLHVLVNPQFSDRILLKEIQDRFAVAVRETDKITSGGVTIFKIDNSSLFMLMKENNAIVMTTDSFTINAIYIKNAEFWRGAKPYR